MADETSKEKVVIDFSTNANAAQKDTDKFRASIDATVTATEEQTQSVGKQDTAYKSLKQQLREAVIEQQKLSAQYGATSAEAIKATKAVAGIKDEISFQKDLVASYNPDEKFRKLTQTAGVAALALGGVKDGFTSLGIESKALDQVIGSAQAILGVTSAVAGMSDAYAVLNASKKTKVATDIIEATTTQAVAVAETEATVATWSWNAALLANPIVLIAAGIAAAGAAIYAFIKITSDAVSEEEKAKVASMQLSEAIDHQAKSFENNNKFATANNNHKIDLLRASGASEAQIYKETKALAEQELQLAKNYRAEAILAEQKAYEANRDNPTEFNAATLKKAQENIEKAKTAVSVGYDGLINLQRSHEVAVVQAQTDANQKAADEQRRIEEKKLQDKKDANAKLLEEQKKFDAEVLAQIGIMNVARVEQEIQDETEEKERISTGLEEASAAADKIDADNEARAQREIDTDKKVLDAKKANQQQIVSGGEQLIKNVAALAGKNKAIQKAAIVTDGGVSVGKAVANTAEAVTKDLAKGMPFSIPLVALDLAVGATSIASIISGTSKALQAVGGGSAPSAPSLPSAQGIAATPQTGFQASSENQISTSINNAQQQTPIIKTFVVGSDVTNQQSLDANLVKQNSFGGAVVK